MIGVNQQNMNGTNKFLVLKTIATQGPITRVELSRLTGLSKMTLTTLTGEYIENGILRECGTTESKAGRKPVLLEAVPESLLTLGVDIGRDAVEVGIVDLCGGVRRYEYASMSRITSNAALLSEIMRLCDAMLAEVGRDKVWGIGVASIGPLDFKNGVILSPSDFNGIEYVPIVDVLQKRYGLPAYLGNDMCVSALAELYFGRGRNLSDFIYLGVSGGIGAGVVLDRELYRGVRGFAGTVGHNEVVPGGELCLCGRRGCFEAYSSVRAGVRWARMNGAPEDLTWPMLLEQASDGDEVCLRALDRMYLYIEKVILNAVNVLDVSHVFLGGDIWYGGKFFVDRLNSAITDKQAINTIGPTAQVALSQFSSNASFIGTAALVMENNLGKAAV